VKYYTKDELMGLIEKAGFDKVNVPYYKAGIMLHGKLFDSTMVITGKK